MTIFESITGEINLRRLRYVFFKLPRWWQLQILLEFDSFQNEAENIPLKFFNSSFERIISCEICRKKFAERIEVFDNECQREDE